jgi:hypothetical protein
MKVLNLFAGAALAAAFAFPVWAQQMKTVGGMVVNIGVMSAIAAQHADAQHGVHTGGHGPGKEHVVVALAEENGGGRIADAEVAIEVKNPKGTVQKKRGLPMVTAGYPDYSEVFDFGWSGNYSVNVLIRRKGAAKPVEARFSVNRTL